MTDNLAGRIRKEIERLSGHKASDYGKWKKEPYLADGTMVSSFWDLVESAPAVRIIGDYDADGICASYIMASSIKNVFPGKKVKVRLPRRFSEGYGISQAIVDEVKEKDEPGTLIVTVDNGITAGDKLEPLEEAGYRVAITDHHVPAGDTLPRVSFVLDPVLEGHDLLCGGNYWCGAGVALKLVEQYVDEQTLYFAQVFAGIATVADCMPLIQGNWVLVRKAVSQIRKGQAPPQVQMLLSALNRDARSCDEDTIGYYLGPALNAPGRLEDTGASRVLKYLLSPSITEAVGLVAVNEERKALRDRQYQQVLEIVKAKGYGDANPIWVEAPGLHQGIVGILAGKLAEEYKVPAIVLTQLPDGTLKGSARSAGEINILEYLRLCGADFIKLGGHAGAAGLTMTKAEFDIGKEYQIGGRAKECKRRSLPIEAWEIPEACRELSKLAPFGEGNPAPRFAVAVDMDLDSARLAGKNREHLIINSGDGWEITHFYHIPNNLENPVQFYVAGKISEQYFNGACTPTLTGDEVFDAAPGRFIITREPEEEEERL